MYMELKERIRSIDVFRGLTILTMIFVNDVAGIGGLPQWMKHMPTEADGMTFVDLVFPAFLFIVGMAIPFALIRRFEKGDSPIQIWKHILSRTFGLLILGVLMVNIGGINPEATGMSKSAWTILMFLGAILFWNQYPAATGNKLRLHLSLKYLGALMLILLAIAYRGGETGNLHWLKTSWWGILGLIGWAYLTTCAVYILLRKHFPAIIGVLAFLIALYIGDKTGKLAFLGFINNYLWIGGHIGGHSAIATAGLITSMILMKKDTGKGITEKIFWILFFAAFMFAIGSFLRPMYGISKNLATPTWCLYSSGLCCMIFVLLYWLIDLKGFRHWAKFIEPAAVNPLIAYILPSIFYAILNLFGITFLSTHFNEGIVGIFRSVIFSFIMVWITSLLNKIPVRLHL